MRTNLRGLAAALFTAAALLWPAPSVAQIGDITIGVDGMT